MRSMSIRPAMANATTSGGLMRKFAFTLWWMRASKLRFPDSTLARDDVVLRERLLELAIERPRVADAGRAAEADEVEAQSVEERLQPGLASGTRSRRASPARARSSPTA